MWKSKLPRLICPSLVIGEQRDIKEKKCAIFKTKGETYMLWKLSPWDALDDKTLCEQLLEKNCRREILGGLAEYIPALYLLITDIVLSGTCLIFTPSL